MIRVGPDATRPSDASAESRGIPDNLMPDPVKLLSMLRRATDLFRSTPGRRGGVVTLESADDVLVVGDLHGNLPSFRKVLEDVRARREPATAPGPAGAHPRVELLSRRRRRQVAPARRPGRRPEVPVPRPGPPDPGQPRALRADRARDRQERRHAQRPVPPGDRDAPTARMPERSTRPITTSSPPSPWRSGPPTASSSATRSPTRSTSIGSTWTCSRPTIWSARGDASAAGPSTR